MTDDDLPTVPCPECGDPVPVTPMYHDECADWEVPDPDDLHEQRVLLEDDVRDLIDEWRERAGDKYSEERSSYCFALHRCAAELLDALEGEQ